VRCELARKAELQVNPVPSCYKKKLKNQNLLLTEIDTVKFLGHGQNTFKA